MAAVPHLYIDLLTGLLTEEAGLVVVEGEGAMASGEVVVMRATGTLGGETQGKEGLGESLGLGERSSGEGEVSVEINIIQVHGEGCFGGEEGGREDFGDMDGVEEVEEEGGEGDVVGMLDSPGGSLGKCMRHEEEEGNDRCHGNQRVMWKKMVLIPKM